MEEEGGEEVEGGLTKNIWVCREKGIGKSGKE